MKYNLNDCPLLTYELINMKSNNTFSLRICAWLSGVINFSLNIFPTGLRMKILKESEYLSSLCLNDILT
jgi:hypothetical protein